MLSHNDIIEFYALQQIAERKKLVSSIKTSIVDQESSDASVTLDTTSIDGGDHDEDHTDISSSSSPSVVHELNENHPRADKELRHMQPSSSGSSPTQFKKFTKEKIQSNKEEASKRIQASSTPIQQKTSNLDSTSHLQKMSLEKVTVNSKISSDGDKVNQSQDSIETSPSKVPASLPKPTPVLPLEDEKYEDYGKSSPEKMKIDNVDLKSEDVKPPPLAGVNVMNIILVAAECAPWSKTGICLIGIKCL